VRDGKGRGNFAGRAVEIPFADSADRFDSWSVLSSPAGTATVPETVGTALPSDPPEPFDGGAATHIFGTTGGDVLTGTALADLIESDWGDDIVDGGDGDDVIVDSGGNNVLRGGAGNDYIRIYNQSAGTVHSALAFANVIQAGDGDDNVEIDLAVRQRLTVDLGAGNDLLTFAPPYIFDNGVHIATGTGADRIVLKVSISWPAERV
jgi:Ca2+-binding RTX toxin-like protein